MLSSYLVTPLINKAKDNSQMRLWSILHISTISLTLLTLMMNLFIIVEQLITFSYLVKTYYVLLFYNYLFSTEPSS